MIFLGNILHAFPHGLLQLIRFSMLLFLLLYLTGVNDNIEKVVQKLKVTLSLLSNYFV